jgi:hypothetical protein
METPIDISQIVTPKESWQSNRPQIVFGQTKTVNSSRPVSFNPGNFAVPSGWRDEPETRFSPSGFYFGPPM